MSLVTTQEHAAGWPTARTQWRVYGDDVSSDIVVSGLPPGTGSTPAIQVLAATAPMPSPDELLREVGGSHGSPLIRLFRTSDGILYDVERVARFWLDNTGTEVRYQLRPGASLSDFDHFLAGPMLGLAFQLRGGIGLHAGAIVLDRKAVGFAAPHGSGKSTLAAALSILGYPLLTDDVLPLTQFDADWYAIQSIPRVKLWDDSLAALGREPGGFMQVTSWVSKKRVTIGEGLGTIAPERVPLGALYVLDPRFEDTDFVVSELSASDAVFELMANLYIPEALTKERSERVIRKLCDLVECVPVRRITYKRTFDAIREVRDQFVADGDWAP